MRNTASNKKKDYKHGRLNRLRMSPCVSVYLMQALAGLLVLAPQTVGTAQVEEHHGPGRAHRAGVTLGGLLPCYSGKGRRDTHTHLH